MTPNFINPKENFEAKPKQVIIQAIAALGVLMVFVALFFQVVNSTYDPDSNFLEIVMIVIPIYGAAIKVNTTYDGNNKPFLTLGVIIALVGILVSALWFIFVSSLTDPVQIAWRSELSNISAELFVATAAGVGLTWE